MVTLSDLEEAGEGVNGCGPGFFFEPINALSVRFQYIFRNVVPAFFLTRNHPE
jgi:hypothetical protein